MIPIETTITEVDNLEGEEIAFTIGDPISVMRNTTRLYSNRELAVVREYSTNARDSEIESGKPKPIEVTLPTLMDPFFTVTDHGVGMSLIDMKDTYTKFGTSTRKTSNDYTGALGFGSKAALSYGNGFTITAVKDSIETIGIVTRKPDYSIVLKVISVKKVVKPSGVKVSIPVHNYEKFSAVANDFYRFWEPGTVLVDGKEPQQAVGDEITKGLYYSQQPGTSYVVMGSVPYRIANPDALFNNAKMNRVSFVAYVPNGAVEFTPSREDLEYSDHTNKTLQGIIDKFEVEMLQRAKKEITKAKTSFEAYSKWLSWGETLGATLFNDLDYDGNKFEKQFEIFGTVWRPNRDDGTYQRNRRTTTWPTGGNEYNRYPNDRRYDVSSMSNTIIVDKVDVQISSTLKAKTLFCEDKFSVGKAKFYIFTSEEFSNPWVDKQRVIHWEDIKSMWKAAQPKLTKAEKVIARRKPQTFDYWDSERYRREEEIPETGTIYWIGTKQSNTRSGFSRALSLVDKDGIVVKVPGNRLAKFKRDNPKAIEFLPFLKSKVVPDPKGTSLLTDQEKKFLSIGSETKAIVKFLDTAKIDDPEFARMKKLIDYDMRKSKRELNRDLDRAAGTGLTSYWISGIIENDDWLETNYPLLLHIDRFSRGLIVDDIYLYINVKYASKGKK